MCYTELHEVYTITVGRLKVLTLNAQSTACDESLGTMAASRGHTHKPHPRQAFGHVMSAS